MAKWRCPKCHMSNHSHAKYCVDCGYVKEKKFAHKEELWRCPICKEVNNEQLVYCQKCGHWLLSETYQAKKLGETSLFERENARHIVLLPAKRTSKVFIMELIFLVVVSAMIVMGEGSLQRAYLYILPWLFIIHLFFSVLYVTRDLFRIGFKSGLLTLLKHVMLLVSLLLLVAIASSRMGL